MNKNTICTDCRHSEKWLSSNRGHGCAKTTDSGPCNSDWKSCSCKKQFHFDNRCEKLNPEPYLNYLKSWPFLQDDRCVHESYEKSGNCEEHLTKLEKLEIDLKKEKAAKEYHIHRMNMIEESNIEKAKTLLIQAGYTVTDSRKCTCEHLKNAHQDAEHTVCYH